MLPLVNFSKNKDASRGKEGSIVSTIKVIIVNTSFKKMDMGVGLQNEITPSIRLMFVQGNLIFPDNGYRESSLAA